MGRFLNADAFVSTGQGFTGNNMFAYCNNNPVFFTDANGESSTIAGALAGAVFGLITGLTASNPSFEDTLACVAIGMVTGAVAGFATDVCIATCGLAAAAGWSAFASGVLGFANSALSQDITDGKVDYGKALYDGVTAAIMGGTGVVMGGEAGKIAGAGLKEGINCVSAMVMTEETMALTQPIISTLKYHAFDIGSSLVTNFGSWLAGLVYTSYSE